MLRILYGDMKMNKKTDFAILMFKVIYIIYTAPFLMFVFLMCLKTLGAFGNPLKEKFGIIKKIMLHFSAIAISTCIWIIVLGILEETLHIKIRLHLFN